MLTDPFTLLLFMLVAKGSKDKDRFEDLLIPLLLFSGLGSQTPGQVVVTPGQPPTLAVPLPGPPAPAPTALAWGGAPAQSSVNSALPLVLLLLLSDEGIFGKEKSGS